MEAIYMFVRLGLGLFILPAILTITGTMGGFVIAKVVQSAAPEITNADVAAITRGWAKAFGLGGAIAAIFFGIGLGATFTWNYQITGIAMADGFAIVGALAGMTGAKTMFQRLEVMISTSDDSTHP